MTAEQLRSGSRLWLRSHDLTATHIEVSSETERVTALTSVQGTGSDTTDDRAAFYDEVQLRAARLRRQLAGRGRPADLPERLAIEQALTTRGYLC